MKRKLLFITPLFPASKDEDTIVPFIAQFTEQFAMEYTDTEIHVLALNYPLKKGTYTFGSITIYALGGGFRKGVFTFIRFLKGLRKAFQLHKEHRYIAMLSFWYGTSAMIGKLLKTRYKIVHKTWLQGQDVKRNNWYLRLFPTGGENLIVISSNQQQLLLKNHKIATDHIANVCINEDSFPELNRGKRTIDIIGIGNLGPIKNYSKFIDVIRLVHDQIPELNVLICGDGEEREALEAKIHKLSLDTTISLLGYVPNQRVKELLNNTSAFLHTSTFEGNPMVLQEALFSGCKVVSTFNIVNGTDDIPNFYYEHQTKALSKRIIALLESNTQATSRVHYFKMKDTLKTVYHLLLESSSKAS